MYTIFFSIYYINTNTVLTFSIAYNLQMNITPIAELRPGRYDYMICVRISRIWEFRGTNEDDNIKHLDLVLLDQKVILYPLFIFSPNIYLSLNIYYFIKIAWPLQGDAIYAEIPPDAIPLLNQYLQEGNIVYISKITVNNAKPSYRAVGNPYMIKLNKRTCIIEAKDQPMDFPKYTFDLVSFDKLHDFTSKTDRFLGTKLTFISLHVTIIFYMQCYNQILYSIFADVIGKIIAVSNAAMISTSSSDYRMRRIVKLQDLR
jgi:replication factor A1